MDCVFRIYFRTYKALDFSKAFIFFRKYFGNSFLFSIKEIKVFIKIEKNGASEK